MSSKFKKIETVVVTASNENPFVDILNMANNYQFIEKDNSKVIRMHIVPSENNEIIKGYLITTKNSGIPPIHDYITGNDEAIDLEESQGLGYSNVFIYNIEFRILMYEFNKNGCYLSTFRKYLIQAYEQDNNIQPLIEFTPFLRREAYERAMGFDNYKSLSVKIKNPSAISQEYKDRSYALNSAIVDGENLNCTDIFLKFNLSTARIDGMPSRIIERILNKLRNMIDPNNEVETISSIKVEGFYQDNEDRTVKDTIDVILDRYIKYIEIEEPRILQDPQENVKLNALNVLYLTCRNDFFN